MKTCENNRGSEMLATILERRDWSQREAGKQLKLGPRGQQVLSALLLGREPKLRLATELRDQLGIPVEAWLQPARKRDSTPPSQAA